MRLTEQQEEDERASSEQALAQARDAIVRDAARLAQNKSSVASLARGLGLTVAEQTDSGSALVRAVAAQLEIVEDMGRKVQSALTPEEAQQWQVIQRAAFGDLHNAEKALREFEARRAETAENRRTEQLRTAGGLSLGVVAVIAGAAISLLGHPIVGVPIAGGGIAFVQQALGKPKDVKEDDKKEDTE